MKYIDYRLKFKAFTKALRVKNIDSRAFKTLLTDKRMSRGEKRILEAIKLFKKGKLDELLDHLKTCTHDHVFLRAYQSMLIGVSFNNLSLYKEANDYLTRSIILFKESMDSYFILSSLKNISFVYYNIGDENGLRESLDEYCFYSQLQVTNKALVEFNKYRIQSCLFDLEGSFIEAVESIDNCLLMKGKEIYAEKFHLVIQKVIFLIKNDNLHEALDALEQTKKYKNYALSAYYNYYKMLLEFLVKDKKLYIYKKDFKESKKLFLMVLFVKELHCGNKFEAEKIWSLLQDIDSHFFLEKLSYSRDDLFKKCLNKITQTSLQEKKGVINFPEGKNSKLDRLEYLTFHCGIKNREKLIFHIWGEYSYEYEARLTALVYRLKKERSIILKSTNGSYFIEKKVG